MLQAAADANILSIGVDSNQNHLHPGKVLTSMVKAWTIPSMTFKAGADVQPGIKVMDLAGRGSVAMDDNNKAPGHPRDAAAVDAAAKASIIDGRSRCTTT